MIKFLLTAIGVIIILSFALANMKLVMVLAAAIVVGVLIKQLFGPMGSAPY